MTHKYDTWLHQIVSLKIMASDALSGACLGCEHYNNWAANFETWQLENESHISSISTRMHKINLKITVLQRGHRQIIIQKLSPWQWLSVSLCGYGDTTKSATTLQYDGITTKRYLDLWAEFLAKIWIYMIVSIKCVDINCNEFITSSITTIICLYGFQVRIYRPVSWVI